MTTKTILQAFENYLRARLTFTQQLADYSSRPVHLECLMRCGAMEHLAPLLSDVSYKVQQCAALAIGRMVNSSEEAAQLCLRLKLVDQLIHGIDNRSKYYKKSAMFVLRGIAKHSPEMAGILLASGALTGIMSCMEDFDAGVKESAIWAVGYIVKHNINHADAVVSAGAVPLLKLALQEPEVCLRQIAAATLSDIAKHDVTLAQSIIDSGCVSCLVKSLPNPSPKLK